MFKVLQTYRKFAQLYIILHSCCINVHKCAPLSINLHTCACILLKKAAGLSKGSSTPNSEKVGKVNRSQLEEIAQAKMADLNAFKVESAMKMVAGTARSMGIIVKGAFPS